MIERNPRNAAEELMWRFIDAGTTHDVDAAMACCADDFVRYGEETNWGPYGKETFFEFWKIMQVAFPDSPGWDVLDIVSSDDSVAMHVIESGTFSKPWVLNGRTIQPNFKKYQDHVVIWAKVQDGLFKSYYNVHSGNFLQTVGDLLDEPSLTASVEKQQ